MTLSFPNQSRSFDSRGNRVRFWGYDSSIEISFFVEADALRMLAKDSISPDDVENSTLRIFDAARKRIHAVAEKLYSRGRKGCYAYSLAAADF